MKIFKEIEGNEIRLSDLDIGDLFEKDCTNSCTTYMVAIVSRKCIACEVIKDADKHTIVVDLKNAVIKALPNKTLVSPLETEGLTVNEKS